MQRIAAPVEASVTVTTVPNANVGLAHVPAGAPYHDASPVVVFCGGGGVGTGLGAGATGLGAGGAVVVVTGFTTGAGTGGGVEVVVVAGTWRYDRLSTPVCGEASIVVVVEGTAGAALGGAAEVTRSATTRGVAHDVGS